LDALFEANYNLWGGRFNPIIPVRHGEIAEPFWSLLRCVDPDIVYAYASLSATSIERIQRELVPCRIEAHRFKLDGSDQYRHFPPTAASELVKARNVLPLLMTRRFGYTDHPLLLTYFHDFKTPRNKELYRLIARNFGIIEENVFPPLPNEWQRLTIQNSSTPIELFHFLANTSNLIFPFQASEAHSPSLAHAGDRREEYCILVGDSPETWLYFWNRTFLVSEQFRRHWNTLCLPMTLLREDSFVGPLREFVKRYARRSGNHPSSFALQSFEHSEEELSALKIKLLNGLDVLPRSQMLATAAFPTTSDSNRSALYRSWGLDATTYQQGTSRASLFSPPRASISFDRGTWMMDLRVQYVPQVDFYDNEVLSWKLPRRPGVAEAFFSNSRIDADHSISVEMRQLTPFQLSLPDERSTFYRVAGLIETVSYDTDLRVIRTKPKFSRMVLGDKALYLNGILELFGGLQMAGRFFGHRYWREIFERLSKGAPEKEDGLLERIRNTVDKKKETIISQLVGGHSRPIDWLSALILKLARDVQQREEDISFSHLNKLFHEQRELFMAANPNFRKPEDIELDREQASAQLLDVVQMLTDRGVLQQGVRARCANCGSRFWREIGSLQQKLKCEGCNFTVPVPVESPWRYRLNSLVRNGIALHGCVAMVSALHRLREKARESFIYTHGVALYRNYDDALPEVEIDLLCISDGKLVCGEVKSSAVDFTPGELTKLARVAMDIRADEVVISAFNDPSGLMERHAQALIALLPDGYSVSTCGPNPWSFQPQPHVL
jgi:hypothetical protein